MKDGLFEMLMNFFEKSLSQLKENTLLNIEGAAADEDAVAIERGRLYLKEPTSKAVRVFTCEEQFKFTRPGYQFLMRMMLWGVVASDTMEKIIHKLFYSDSRFVTLEETKWAIRTVLAEELSASQMAFLDLVLYQEEDGLPLH